MRGFRVPICLVVLLASLLAACGTKSVPAAHRLRPSSVAMFDGLPLPPYRKIRQIQTTSCAYELGREPKVAEAQDQLRLEAARLGGNAIANVMCHPEPARPYSPCWKVARCTAEVACASSETNHRVDGTCSITR